MRMTVWLWIDHDPLNNMRDNLRIVTQKQNRQNSVKTSSPKSSKYKGVYFCQSRQHWIVQILLDGKKTFIGSFSSELDAARAYNRTVDLRFGEYACLNDLPPEDDSARTDNDLTQKSRDSFKTNLEKETAA